MEKKNKITTIVVVDDEKMVLKSIESFFRLETDYNIKSFTSAREALDYVRKNPVDLVLSDYLMPEMDGITFLKHVREAKPEVPRIILTGYADKENAIKAINEVGLFQYIEKPWDNNDLMIVIRNGLEIRYLQKKLEEKMSEINRAYNELQSMHKEIMKTFV